MRGERTMKEKEIKKRYKSFCNACREKAVKPITYDQYREQVAKIFNLSKTNEGRNQLKEDIKKLE